VAQLLAAKKNLLTQDDNAFLYMQEFDVRPPFVYPNSGPIVSPKVTSNSIVKPEIKPEVFMSNKHEETKAPVLRVSYTLYTCCNIHNLLFDAIQCN
jgi:hypothetical protein